MPSPGCRVSNLSRVASLALLLGLGGLLASYTPPRPLPAPAAVGPERPRLAVLVIFDQMRGDYLERWQALFGEAGFRRLEEEGAWFQSCRYPYASTVTAAGHASVPTGCRPATHGIIGNEWYDRAAGAQAGCVASDRYERVPPPPAPKKGEQPKKKGVSPERLLAPTLADSLKQATAGRGRVVALSFKDRSAVLPAGQAPDACYWLDTSTGTFVTSTYYRERPHRWVAEFNAERPADQWFGKDWTRLRPELDYARYSGPDDVPGEGPGFYQGRTFPHTMRGGPFLQAPTALYYGALYSSPFSNELLLDLAKRAIDGEHLGSGSAPDLLCLSFSGNDAVGHAWGPDSQEVLDVTLRSDLIVRDLLAHLDARVGKGRYVLALTADHGVCPLPEVSRAQGKDAGRLQAKLLGKQADEFLKQTYGKGEADKARWVAAVEESWVYLNDPLLRQRGLTPGAVGDKLAGWLREQPGIDRVYTRGQLSQDASHGDEIDRLVRASDYPARAGDLYVIPKPYWVVWDLPTGTTHGTARDYDRHVPLLVYGPGVRKGVRHEPVTPLATAAILARALGIRPPEKAEYPVPEGLFEAVSKRGQDL